MQQVMQQDTEAGTKKDTEAGTKSRARPRSDRFKDVEDHVIADEGRRLADALEFAIRGLQHFVERDFAALDSEEVEGVLALAEQVSAHLRELDRRLNDD
jgi:hypothetical protein